jgi:hypothetical protein
MNKEHAGDIGWGLLAAGVIAWDVLAPETLSGAVDRYLEHPKGKYLAWAAGGIVTGHVLNIIPPKYDIIHLIADRLEQ